MSITTYIDAHDKIYNFEKVYTGPGIYILYDGRVCDQNITYIGKSTVEMMMRVKAHQTDKEFDGVGVILPAHRKHEFIHDLEALVIASYCERFRELPPFNFQQPRVRPGRRHFDWTAVARRDPDLRFE